LSKAAPIYLIGDSAATDAMASTAINRTVFDFKKAIVIEFLII
jgi:hypothetical protein